MLYPKEVRKVFGIDISKDDIFEELENPINQIGEPYSIVCMLGIAKRGDVVIPLLDCEVSKVVDGFDTDVRLPYKDYFDIPIKYMLSLLNCGYGALRGKDRYYSMQTSIDHAARGMGNNFSPSDKGTHFEVKAIVVDFRLHFGQLEVLKKLNNI